MTFDEVKSILDQQMETPDTDRILNEMHQRGELVYAEGDASFESFCQIGTITIDGKSASVSRFTDDEAIWHLSLTLDRKTQAKIQLLQAFQAKEGLEWQGRPDRLEVIITDFDNCVISAETALDCMAHEMGAAKIVAQAGY